MTDRRSFLKFAGLAPAAAAGVAGAAPAAAREENVALLRSGFAGCVGDEFQFEEGPFTRVAMRLDEIAPVGRGASRVLDDRVFCLRFAPAASATLPSGTYRVTHPRLGAFVLFVSAFDARGGRLEAVFNQA